MMGLARKLRREKEQDDRALLDQILTVEMRAQGEATLARQFGDLYIRMGVTAYGCGELEKAAGSFEKAAALLGAHSDFDEADKLQAFQCANWLGATYQRMCRHGEARKWFTMALKLDPQRSNADTGLMHYFMRHGTDSAIEEYLFIRRQCLSDDPLSDFFASVRASFPSMVERLEAIVARNASAAKRILVVPVPVWGDKFVKALLDCAIPCWLAQGNFPAVAKERDIRIVFFCPAHDAKAIDEAPITAKLRKFAQVDFLPYADRWLELANDQIVRFQLFSLSHYVALEAGRRHGWDCAFAFPDNIVSDRFYSEVIAALDAGASAVCCQGFRLFEGVVRAEVEKCRRRDVISIPAQHAIDMLVRHLDDSWFADSENLSSNPFVVCWRAGSGGLIARSSHFQPYAIRAAHLRGALSPRIDPLDGLFLPRHLHSVDDVVCVDDDRLCAFDMSANPNIGEQSGGGRSAAGAGIRRFLKGVLPDRIRRRFLKGARGDNQLDARVFARFCQEYLSPLHRRYLGLPIRLGGQAKGADFAGAEVASREFMESVMRVLDRFEAEAPDRPHWAVDFVSD